MSDNLKENSGGLEGATSRADGCVILSGRRQSSGKLADAIFKGVSYAFALSVIILMALIFIVLVKESWLSIKAFGFSFIYTSVWDPVALEFGALPSIYGTIVSSLIAIVIAVPISLGIAIFLTEMAPKRIKGPIGTAIELLASIPSIIYGMWGLFVFAPGLSESVEPLLLDYLGFIPPFTGAPPGV